LLWINPLLKKTPPLFRADLEVLLLTRGQLARPAAQDLAVRETRLDLYLMITMKDQDITLSKHLATSKMMVFLASKCTHLEVQTIKKT
jgi:hypothetical protein